MDALIIMMMRMMFFIVIQLPCMVIGGLWKMLVQPHLDRKEMDRQADLIVQGEQRIAQQRQAIAAADARALAEAEAAEREKNRLRPVHERADASPVAGPGVPVAASGPSPAAQQRQADSRALAAARRAARLRGEQPPDALPAAPVSPMSDEQAGEIADLAAKQRRETVRKRPKLDGEALAAHLNGKVIGQEHVVKNIVATLRRRTVMLEDKRKGPLAVFLFVGSSGSGKTEITKQLTSFLFGGDVRGLIRLDMGDFGESHTAQRLVGPPPGYEGSKDGGQLTRPLLNAGGDGRVILFDEIEKSHEKVFDYMLRLLDEGQITDASNGETADARKCIVILTSNLLADELTPDMSTETVTEKIKRTGKMRPELVNRISQFGGICVFSPLNDAAIAAMTRKLLGDAAGAYGQTIIGIDNETMAAVVAASPSSEGVRGVQRVVGEMFNDALLELAEDGVEKIKFKGGKVFSAEC